MSMNEAQKPVHVNYDSTIRLDISALDLVGLACATKRLAKYTKEKTEVNSSGVAYGNTEQERRANAYHWVATEYDIVAASIELISRAQDIVADALYELVCENE